MADDDFQDNDSQTVQSIPQKVGAFIYSAKRVLNVAKKPDWNEYKGIIKICAIGIVTIGVIGYITILIFSLIRGV